MPLNSLPPASKTTPEKYEPERFSPSRARWLGCPTIRKALQEDRMGWRDLAFPLRAAAMEWGSRLHEEALPESFLVGKLLGYDAVTWETAQRKVIREDLVTVALQEPLRWGGLGAAGKLPPQLEWHGHVDLSLPSPSLLSIVPPILVEIKTGKLRRGDIDQVRFYQSAFSRIPPRTLILSEFRGWGKGWVATEIPFKPLLHPDQLVQEYESAESDYALSGLLPLDLGLCRYCERLPTCEGMQQAFRGIVTAVAQERVPWGGGLTPEMTGTILRHTQEGLGILIDVFLDEAPDDCPGVTLRKTRKLKGLSMATWVEQAKAFGMEVAEAINYGGITLTNLGRAQKRYPQLKEWVDGYIVENSRKTFEVVPYRIEDYFNPRHKG